MLRIHKVPKDPVPSYAMFGDPNLNHRHDQARDLDEKSKKDLDKAVLINKYGIMCVCNRDPATNQAAGIELKIIPVR